MKEYIAEPKVLVNIKSLPGLDKIEPGDKVWTIGANVTVAELEDHAGLKRTFPGCNRRRPKSARGRSATSPPSAAISRSIRAAGITAIATCSV